MIDIGRIIQDELKRQERTPAWLARKINCGRSNIYYIFNLQSINTELLRQICIALGKDFFKIYSDSLPGHDGK
ncbi:MAG: XRE family transcriptional regulator [Duncaniella sp.]|nr:XRE family transcriptional regulator [Duncaniella sp.]MDE6067059.1 XRE family transcriptional regulator [Duncaniella sp.]